MSDIVIPVAEAGRKDMDIFFKDLGYTIQVQDKSNKSCCKTPMKQRKLLDGLNGHFKRGELIAIMGASGAGKSTFLDVLSGRKNAGKTEGELLFGGKPRDRLFKANTGYVEQQDLLFETLTVRETLQYAARLKLPQSMSDDAKDKRVQAVIESLGLTKCANTQIGGQLTRGISGGEAKRVSIGMELVADPSLLFLDEPTSGLDSSTSFDVVSVLKDIARSGCLVVCTIHQPSADTLMLFDRLMILSAGRTLYLGPTKKAAGYFQDLGFVPRTKYTNPADFVLAAGGAGTQSNDSAGGNAFVSKAPELTLDQLTSKFESSQYGVLNQQEVARAWNEIQSIDADSDSQKDSDGEKYATSGPFAFATLFKRTFIKNNRNPAYRGTRLFRLVSTAILFSTIFWQIGANQAGLFKFSSILFFTCVNLLFGAMAYLSGVFKDRVYFVRERAAGLYRVSSYWAAMFFAEVPYAIISAALYSVVQYWAVGFRQEAGPFFFFMLVVIVVNLIAVAFAQAVAALAPGEDTGFAIAPLVLTLGLLFSGFAIPIDQIPVWWIWAPYLTPFRWALQALVVNDFTNRPFTCTDSELRFGVCPITNGSSYVKTLSFDNVDHWISFIILVGFLVFLNLVTYLALRFRRYATR